MPSANDEDERLDPARTRPGCLKLGCLGAIALVVIAIAGAVALDAYSRSGAGAAGRSYDDQSGRIYETFDAVPFPPNTVREGFGMSEDLREPFGHDSAVAAYERGRHPLREILDVICLGSCPGRWRPSDGVLIKRFLQVPSMKDAEVCAFFASALSTSSLGADVTQGGVAPEFRGILCGFEGLHDGVLVSISVLRGDEGGAAIVHLDGATRGHACYSPLLSPPQRPDCPAPS